MITLNFRLHQEIEDFYQYMKPQPWEENIRTEVFNRIKNVILKRWPEAVVDFFGSFRTGLFLPTSDIDVVVVGKWSTYPFESIKEAMETDEVADSDSILILDKASVLKCEFFK